MECTGGWSEQKMLGKTKGYQVVATNKYIGDSHYEVTNDVECL